MRRAFTLMEILVVIIILGTLAAMVVPRFAGAEDAGRTQAMAATVKNIRQLIQYHAVRDEFPQAPSGFPEEVSGEWFMHERLPLHSWTGHAMVVDTVDGPAAQIYPAAKTFVPNGDNTAINAWYNRTNGAYCGLIVAESTDAATIAQFNEANGAQITALNQTTR